MVLAPSCDQRQWLGQKILVATFYAASKGIISYRLAVSGASNQDEVKPVLPTLAQYSEMGLPFDLEAPPKLAAPSYQLVLKLSHRGNQ